VTKKYRPSNGNEGDIFMSKWCDNCIRDTEDKACKILGDSLCWGIDDDGYPDEWTYNDAGFPICTAFSTEEKPYRCSDTGDMFG